MLVGTFQIQVCRETERFCMRTAQDGLVGRTGIEPDIERVAVLFVQRRFFTQQFFRIEGLPGFDTLFFDTFCDFLKQFQRSRMQFTGFTMYEKGHRNAPLALARERPVGTVGDHALQACLAPVRIESGLFDTLERRFAQGQGCVVRFDVHAGEPL